MNEIDLLRRIAAGVREAILKKYPLGGGGDVVGMGADGTPTFEMDSLAENVAFEILDGSGFEMNVLSEEAQHIDRGSDLTLLIDPIDRLYNAVNGIPFFSISLAISQGGLENVQHALVADIIRGVTYHASLGKGAFRDGESIHTRKFVPGEAIISARLSREGLDDKKALLSMAKKARSLGCISLETCLVAQGSFDLFAMSTRSPRIVDIAGCMLILKEAGGNVFWYRHGGSWGEYILTNKGDSIDGILSLGDTSFAPEIFRSMKKEA